MKTKLVLAGLGLLVAWLVLRKRGFAPAAELGQAMGGSVGSGSGSGVLGTARSALMSQTQKSDEQC